MAGKVYIPNITFEHRRPSIIAQRKKKTVEIQERVDPLLEQEIDRALSSDFQIRDGMLVCSPQKQPSNSVPGPSTAARVVVINSGEPHNYLRPRPLPGIADEVQSYPCRICNRVFLTENGLIKHIDEKQDHKPFSLLINEDIQSINAEWKRRDQWKKRENLVVKKNIRIPVVKSRKNLNSRPKSPGVYEACNICETIVKLDTADALERHKQKHLMESDGETTSDLHCAQCALTFMNHGSYIKHLASHRKRTFVCRYCGSRFLGFAELKRHKMEYHEYKVGYSTQNSRRIANGSFRRPLNTNFRYPESSNVRASCDKCDLSFHRVELLIRHVVTVHQASTFNAKIDVRGMPVYGILVKNGKINYQCCNLIFEDKVQFIAHRQNSHEPTFES